MGDAKLDPHVLCSKKTPPKFLATPFVTVSEAYRVGLLQG